MAKHHPQQGWTAGIHLWIDQHGQTMLGQGRADLLEAIGQHQSITAAAKAVGMSYRKAWSLVQEVNEAAGQPLVEAAVGGTHGGGARLTERGQFALDVYRKLDRALETSATRALAQLMAPPANLEAGRCIHVAAAISLQEALGQILTALAVERPDVRVRAIYGASNELADLLLAGAPGDLFISAEAGEIDKLDAAGRIVAGSRRLVAINGLTVIGPKRHGGITRLADLEEMSVKRIVLAEPACPLGHYSKAYLESTGKYNRLLPKVLHVDNSRAVLSAVAAGAADVGLAFNSDMARANNCAVLFQIPQANAAAQYFAARLASDNRQLETQELLDFLSSPTALQRLQQCGFQTPISSRPKAPVK